MEQQSDLHVEYVDISSLIPYANNAKLHPGEQVEQISNSIETFGFNDPIGVWQNGDGELEIVEGHGRVLAASELGIESVPIIRLDHLTDEQRKAYALVHNKLTMNSDFDFDILEKELSELEGAFDMEDFGFDMLEDDIPSEPKEIIEDEVPEDAPSVCNPGNIWKLGNHRLMCGDSTDAECFNRLMDGIHADIVVTSPPYNAHHMDIPLSGERGGGTQNSTQKKYLMDNDNRTDDEYFEFLCANMDVLLAVADEVFYNIGVASGSKSTIARLLHHYSDKFKELLYWVKDNPMPIICENVISSATELIIAFGDNNSRAFNHFNDRHFHGVIYGHSASSNPYADIHKATFPVYLPSEIISRFAPENGTVIDCFGGTGTTLIACEQLNRKCYMMELDPHYCDVIIKRWEELTGEKAERLHEDVREG